MTTLGVWESNPPGGVLVLGRVWGFGTRGGFCEGESGREEGGAAVHAQKHCQFICFHRGYHLLDAKRAKTQTQ